MYNYFQGCGSPYGNLQPGMVQYQTPIPQLKGRPVSSIEEARAAQIDFDGSTFIFPDTANKRIYTKCINLDGTSSLCTFELVKNPIPQSSENYVTKEELNRIIDELKQSLKVEEKRPIVF